MNNKLFKGNTDYWSVVDVIKHLYMSDGSMNTLLDYERVLDDMNIYAFQNWSLGELVEGPEVKKYSISCTFMWPLHLMPDPRAGKRLLQFGCKILYMKSSIKIPIKINDPDDFEENTKMPKLVKKEIWLVEIVMPKELVNDIRTGSIDMEDQKVDLNDLDLAYEQDIDKEAEIDNNDAVMDDELDLQGSESDDMPFGDEEF